MPSFDDYIEQLEKFSSVIFAYTFLLFFMVLSFVAYLTVFIFLNYLEDLLVNDSQSNTTDLGMVIIFLLWIPYLFFSLMVFFDLITLGRLKRIKDPSFSRFYLVVYRIFSFITLSFFYRSLLYNFIDEKYTRRFFLLAIPYFLIFFFGRGFITDPAPYFPLRNARDASITNRAIADEYLRIQFYDDLRAEWLERNQNFPRKRPLIQGLSLASQELTGSHGKLFLRSYPTDGDYLKQLQGIDPFHRSGVRHKALNNAFPDEAIKRLKTERDSILEAFNQKRSDYRRGLREGAFTSPEPGLILRDGALKMDSEYWDRSIDSIGTSYQDRIDGLLITKVRDVKDVLLELCRVTIDSIPYNDSLSAKFYIHPNLGERGLLCYFPIKHLALGEHTLYLERKLYSRLAPDSLETRFYAVPFWIVEPE